MSKKENSNQNCNLNGKIIFFATGNINKFNEARNILSQYGVSVGMLRLKGDEIQSDSLKEIALLFSAEDLIGWTACLDLPQSPCLSDEPLYAAAIAE